MPIHPSFYRYVEADKAMQAVWREIDEAIMHAQNLENAAPNHLSHMISEFATEFVSYKHQQIHGLMHDRDSHLGTIETMLLKMPDEDLVLENYWFYLFELSNGEKVVTIRALEKYGYESTQYRQVDGMYVEYDEEEEPEIPF